MLQRLVAVGATLASAWMPVVLDVKIDSPTEGATVGGVIQVRGTAEDVGDGRVSVRVDNGPFQLANGTDMWTFTLDTTALSEGPHTITARAREFIGGPAVFDSVNVIVDNEGGGLSVRITAPADGADVTDTLTVWGQSELASLVEIRADQDPWQPVNGLDPWNAVFEPGALTPGPHTITARASDGVDEVSDSISINVAEPPPGIQTITYASSVDGEPLDAKLWIPDDFDPQAGDVPLVLHLHGGGGLGNISTALQAELDARDWIGLAPDGRRWGLAQLGCNWQTSAAYVNNPDPNVGPGEQDILDAIDWAQGAFPIDVDRIYLIGFSMGGRGTYIIGLKNPDRFAAIGPMGPAIDMYEIFVRRPEPRECKEGMVGGQPGDSPFVDTMYTITSGRFLVENAYNLPVYHGHGLNDTVANNTPTNAPFLHGWHITSDTGWSGCHAGLCFGHTPTLSELAARHPDGFDWAFMFTPVGHSTDPQWFSGAPDDGTNQGVPDPQDPSALLGMFDFFAARTRVHSPDTVLFKSYTDEHERAYWVELDISTPWLDTPGAVRATRDAANNLAHVELVRAERATFDLARAGLRLTATDPLTLFVEPLVEPVYDPALAAPGELLEATLVVEGDFAALGPVRVLRDGAALEETLIVRTPTTIEVGPLLIDALTTIEIQPVFAAAR